MRTVHPYRFLRALFGAAEIVSGRLRDRHTTVAVLLGAVIAITSLPAQARPVVVAVTVEPLSQIVRIYDPGLSASAVQGEVRVGRALDFEGAPVYLARVKPAGAIRGSTGGLSLRSLPLRSPLSRAAKTSGFGMRAHPLLGGMRFHSGIDLAAPQGSTVVATADGIVVASGWNGGYGLEVLLNHGGGLETRYGHLSRITVQLGQSVRAGETIGLVGSTGRSTGPHLHYETRVNGTAVRPPIG